MATRVLICGVDVAVRQEERAEKVEDGVDVEPPEEEGARAEGQEAVSTPEDQGGDHRVIIYITLIYWRKLSP
jgi:hypothetical protein